MNILAVCGSPRRGNTEFALKRFLTVADAMGHKTELVLLREKRIEHCRGCLSCNNNESCALLDDMKSIIEQIERNDLVIIGSPNYFDNVSGLMKDFIDRLCPCCADKALCEKKIVSLFVGEESSSGEKAMATIESMSKALDAYFIGGLYLVAKNDQDLEKNPDELHKLEGFTNNVLK